MIDVTGYPVMVVVVVVVAIVVIEDKTEAVLHSEKDVQPIFIFASIDDDARNNEMIEWFAKYFL